MLVLLEVAVEDEPVAGMRPPAGLCPSRGATPSTVQTPCERARRCGTSATAVPAAAEARSDFRRRAGRLAVAAAPALPAGTVARDGRMLGGPGNDDIRVGNNLGVVDGGPDTDHCGVAAGNAPVGCES